MANIKAKRENKAERNNYLKAGEMYEKAGNYLKAGEMYEKVNDYQKAGEMYEKAKEYKKAGEMYEHAKNWNKAGEMYELVENWNRAGEMYEKAENYLKAGEIYEKIEEYEKAGKMYDLAKNYQKAGEMYLQCCLKSPFFLDVKKYWNLYADQLEKAKKGPDKESEKWLKKWIISILNKKEIFNFNLLTNEIFQKITENIICINKIKKINNPLEIQDYLSNLIEFIDDRLLKQFILNYKSENLIHLSIKVEEEKLKNIPKIIKNIEKELDDFNLNSKIKNEIVKNLKDSSGEVRENRYYIENKAKNEIMSFFNELSQMLDIELDKLLSIDVRKRSIYGEMYLTQWQVLVELYYRCMFFYIGINNPDKALDILDLLMSIILSHYREFNIYLIDDITNLISYNQTKESSDNSVDKEIIGYYADLVWFKEVLTKYKELKDITGDEIYNELQKYKDRYFIHRNKLFDVLNMIENMQ